MGTSGKVFFFCASVVNFLKLNFSFQDCSLFTCSSPPNVRFVAELEKHNKLSIFSHVNAPDWFVFFSFGQQMSLYTLRIRF